jgi:hypothetical protein
MVAKRVVAEERMLEGKRILVRIVSILCVLVDRFDTPGQLRDESTAYGEIQSKQAQLVSYTQRKPRTRTRARTRRSV